MANDAHFSVIGFVATQPKGGYTKAGSRTVSMRVGWTPRSFDRTTGAWGDQPSSFITVQCYKKIAEHAAVCLRRGDPIVVRGTLRVREFVDQSGQRRSSVEVIADSIGHDLSRGITVFSKAPAQVERTAYEYEQAMAAEEGRDPLPGDRSGPESPAALEQGAGRDGDEEAEPGRDSDEQAGPAGRGEVADIADPADIAQSAEAESGDGPDPEFGASGAFDDAVRRMIADADDASVPVGASS
jgi:single-strand DNA-binding protein